MTEMTEAQKVIAETVRAHLWYFVGNLGVPGMPDRRGYKCGCGWSTGDPDDPGFEDPHGACRRRNLQGARSARRFRSLVHPYCDGTGVVR